MKIYIFTLLLVIQTIVAKSQTPILNNYSVLQCDSLIKVNRVNPNFVILDIRTPGEYNPEHLEGAIMRDFYASDFKDQLNKLDKDKTYLMHCRSGGRSGTAMGFLSELGFNEVYNMLGGINKWKSKGLGTTNLFAPQLMLASDSVISKKNSTPFAIDVTVTNRANDVLQLTGISGIIENGLISDFDSSITLKGSEDYTFNVELSDGAIVNDTFNITIQSNGGDIHFEIRVTTTPNGTKDAKKNRLNCYPNPATEWLVVSTDDKLETIRIIDQKGSLMYQINNTLSPSIDISNYKTGIYYVQIGNGKKIITKKIMIK